MKILAFIICLFTGFLLFSGVSDLPSWGDPNSPANSYVSAHYIENTLSDSHVPNVVTSVLADYRSFDTMFETGVVFVALIAIIGILRRRKSDGPKSRKKDPYNMFIVRVACRLMTPFMQLFGLYVLAHGHYSPGGGFQGGVILGASFILLALAFDSNEALKKYSEKWIILTGAIGVLIFAGTGLISLFGKKMFLDYSILQYILPATDSVMARSHAMLIVEIGVCFTVMAGMIGIFLHMSSQGSLDKGM